MSVTSEGGAGGGFLSEWHPPLRDVARAFSRMAARCADELEVNARDVAPDTARLVRAKQCLLRMIGMLCFTGGKLDPPDVQQLLSLGVLTHHGHAYGQDTDLQQQLAELRVRCHWQLVRQASQVVGVAGQNTAMLTRALRTVLEHAPEELQWERVRCAQSQQRCGGSFQAMAGGHLYSLNCLDGTVLMDGTPPDRLPREIVEHPLFTRSFGSWSFEVSTTSEGRYITTSPVRGCFYSFFMATSGRLVVEEEDGTRNRLELLDPGETQACKGWGHQLPLRLRELYSHWLCRDEGVVVLRPRHFQRREVHFLICWDQECASSTDVPYACFRIPPHLRDSSRHWKELRPLLGTLITHQMVLHSSQITAVMAKFERPEFIHAYASWQPTDGGSSVLKRLTTTSVDLDGHCTVVFDMPRFSLEFEMREDGQLWSRDYAGYHLQPCQQLYEDDVQGPADLNSGGGGTYTLPDFRQYLILVQPLHGPEMAGGVGKKQVLVPEGAVLRVAEEVQVEHSGSSRAALKVHSYMVHPRFGHLASTSIPARLQLAALYAATSSLLPEPGSNMTGAQMAMRLVRQTWVNKPLQPAGAHRYALQQLDSAARLGGHLASALRLLVWELKASMAQLLALHSPDTAPECVQLPPFDTDWRLAYEVDPGLRQASRNPHLLLTPAEEQRVGQLQRAGCEAPLWKILKLFQAMEVPPCPVQSEVVSCTEARLRALVITSPPEDREGGGAVPGYPLQAGGQGGTPLEQEMHAELEASWEEHHAQPAAAAVRADTKRTLLLLQARVEVQRQQAQDYLASHLPWVPDSVGLPASGFRLLQAAAAAAIPGLMDFVRLGVELGGARRFNPFLSDVAALNLQHGARVWLQLCMLEDRLQRLLGLVGDASRAPELIQELQVHRQWSVDQHPEWLVFEVEGQLQIRPVQYWVANHLILHPGSRGGPGSIVQLNMGEGKTRVILPMLILHWANGSNLVRLNLLPALLEEAFSHLHACLCASVLGRKLFVQPFHRDVQVSKPLVAAMRAALTYCKQAGGVLLTTPERRLSLALKRQELHEQGQAELCAELDKLAGMEYIDVLDESDELLSHRYQLIYAWGRPSTLPSEQARARACQALLRTLSLAPARSPLGQTLAAEGVAVCKTPKHPGAYQGLRLLPGVALRGVLPTLRRQLADALLREPPYSLRWMRREGVKERILEYLVDPTLDAADIVGGLRMARGSAECSEDEEEERQGSGKVGEEMRGGSQLGEEEQCDLLALRGLLACGVLEHCLQMRHRVEFGVNRSPPTGSTRRKRLAVPFRAAHLPSDRSEYAQPDTALVLTTLSYYSDGLSRVELLEALHQLLKMGLNAQRAVYQEWWALLEGSPQVAAGSITHDELRALDDVSKLDTTNAQMVDLAHRLFSHNMCALDFFLDACVFPLDTRQFPQRLVANAWHLADSPRGRVVGFSGTNDSHRLLPLRLNELGLDQRWLWVCREARLCGRPCCGLWCARAWTP